jgi:hypothetical protein
MRRRLVVIAAAALLGACTTESSSDGTTSAERDAYATALAANWGLGGDSGFVLIGGRARCVAESWISVIGAGRLRDEGIEPADLDPREGGAFRPLDLDLTSEQASTMVDAFGDCGADVVELFVTARADELSDEARACLRSELTPELAEAVVESSLTSSELQADLAAELAEIGTTCTAD